MYLLSLPFVSQRFLVNICFLSFHGNLNCIEDTPFSWRRVKPVETAISIEINNIKKMPPTIKEKEKGENSKKQRSFLAFKKENPCSCDRPVDINVILQFSSFGDLPGRRRDVSLSIPLVVDSRPVFLL